MSTDTILSDDSCVLAALAGSLSLKCEMKKDSGKKTLDLMFAQREDDVEVKDGKESETPSDCLFSGLVDDIEVGDVKESKVEDENRCVRFHLKMGRKDASESDDDTDDYVIVLNAEKKIDVILASDQRRYSALFTLLSVKRFETVGDVNVFLYRMVSESALKWDFWDLYRVIENYLETRKGMERILDAALATDRYLRRR